MAKQLDGSHIPGLRRPVHSIAGSNLWTPSINGSSPTIATSWPSETDRSWSLLNTILKDTGKYRQRSNRQQTVDGGTFSFHSILHAGQIRMIMVDLSILGNLRTVASWSWSNGKDQKRLRTVSLVGFLVTHQSMIDDRSMVN